MLQEFRNNLKGAAVLIVILISIPFALVGIDQIFVGGSGVEPELNVNGEDISRMEIDRALALQKQWLFEQYENLNPAMLDDELLRPSIKKRLVREKVVAQRAKDVGMGVDDKMYIDLLKNIEAFQVEGQFDRDVFDFAIRQRGHTQKSYYEAIKEGMLISQVTSALTGSAMVTTEDLVLTAELLEQERDYYYLTIPGEKLRHSITIDDAEIEQYHRDNLAEFTTDQKIVVDYIELAAEDLATNLEVDEAVIRERFDAELVAIEGARRIRAEHILLNSGQAGIDQARVKEVLDRLHNGQAFGDLARQYSDDPGSAQLGGDLGYVNPDLFPQAFAEALGTLEVGEVSPPVKTESGLHLIRLAEKEVVEVPDYKEARDRIETQIKVQLAEQAFPGKVAQLQELAYNAGSLAEVGDELNIPARISLPFARNGGEGIAAYPVVVDAAFATEVFTDGHVSEVIELSPTRVAVVKLREVLPAEILPLDEVRANIETRLTDRAVRELVSMRGANLLVQVRDENIGVEDLAKKEGLPWQVSIDTRRFGGPADPEIRQRVFAIPARSSLPHTVGFTTEQGDFVVASLTKVKAGNLVNIPPVERDRLRESIQKTVAQQEYQAYETSLVAQAAVEGA